MIPLPDSTRLFPPRGPISSGTGRGGCSDFSGCTLGCGGILMVIALTLLTTGRFGAWAGVATLAVAISAAIGISKAPKPLAGSILGALYAALVWWIMKPDYFNQPVRMILSAAIAFGVFLLAGYFEGKRRP